MYRKFKAGGIFTGRELLSGDNVLVTDDSGKVSAIVAETDAGDNIETYEGLLSPGFINCHCHIELSYLKGLIPRHTGLVAFVQKVMANRSHPLPSRISAMHLAAAELYNTGTVVIGDICNTEESVGIKINSPIWWHNFIEVSGFVGATANKRLGDAEKVAGAFAVLPFPFSLVPHAPYSVSKELFGLLNEKSKDQLITIHNQEEATENDLYENKRGSFLKLYHNLGIDISSFQPTGKSSFQSWQPYFNKGQRIISVHNTFISNEDLKCTMQHPTINISYCICINANLYIENVVPPIEMLMEQNCRIVLGTDSYASNTQLNMLEEMKQIQNHFPAVHTNEILQWATLNGAQALGVDLAYGSFEPGKKPAVVLIENMNEGKFSAGATSRILIK